MIQHLAYGFKNVVSWKRWLRDMYLDLKFGFRFLGGNISNGSLVRGFSPSTSSDYDAIAAVFAAIDLRPNDVVVDVGCGKGRVFNWALNNGIKNKLIGVEVDAAIAEFTRLRLKKYPNINVITGNIADFSSFPKHGTVFYLFNPFSEEIVKQFAEHILQARQLHEHNENRPLIIYYNCYHLGIFEKNPLWKIEKLGVVSAMNLPAAIIYLHNAK